ncbi:MAG TPA: protein kinase [Thermoanaerobaculia bacterium]|nr:protein kinase [Thermoanaerobaculia bacterium]
MSTPAPFLSRHLGDYLLVAQLSEDPLGTVFRALYAADERRFVRLRVLQSEELAAEVMRLTVCENRLRDVTLAHDAIVVRPELDLVEDIPFMTWDEAAGWTLDTMLGRVRSFGIRIPAEYALLIAERVAAALEHAHQTTVHGGPLAHGLLWPGFVTISYDAVVRVGGFGIAEGILPSLGGRRMTAEIAPYVAPESRRDAKPSPQADVYSLGAILMELMTGRRPSLETPSTELRAGDPRSEELSGFLQKCLADPSDRFPSAVEAHRALQQMVTGNPFSLFTANLALFLYKLLNPESQSVAPSSDWESTSPVVTETKRRENATGSSITRRGDTPRRRRGDLDPTEETSQASHISTIETSEPFPSSDESPEPPFPAAARDDAPAPLAVQERALELIEAAPATEPLSPPWKRQALLLAAAAGLAAGAFFVAGRLNPSAVTVAPPPPDALANAAIPAPTVATVEVAPPAPAPAAAVVAAVHVSAPAHTARKVHSELKQPAEDQRYKAAIARIEADRLSAREKAPDVFQQGELSEKEGIRLLHDRDYDAAQMAFSKAAHLFEQARDRSWEERIHGASLSENRD